MDSIFDLWVKSCGINGSKIFPVAGEGETAVYMCWKDFIGPDHQEYRETPVYIGWIDGKEVCATTNYLSALACWNNRKKELSWRTDPDDT